MRIADKVCVITGGSSGIGEACAKIFAREGGKIAVVDVDEMNGERVVGDIRQDGAEAMFVKADVADERQSRQCLETVVQSFGRIDVLVNNAGVSAVGDVAQCAPEDWDRVMRVNVRGVYLMSHFVVPIMRDQGQGTIIQMSSTIALVGLQSRAAYAASKGAVLALTRAMAADHSHENIRVAAVLPGTVYTPFVQGYLERSYADDMEQAISNLKKRQLNNELMTPDDVAYAALYLASDEARFALGTALIIDGGVSTAKVF
ncbi:MAG: short-chain dehydrogenase [Sulfobacillus acidophilus]|uniref:Short-chain dehydrogenase n=1 Tax=Sulfobacillus acidophilus TaxID=53633 RepID=A0A2T2WF61_9FIRM|nr:MAG: short-chain dehydrogenase [Sulfobacillus acidophilus]